MNKFGEEAIHEFTPKEHRWRHTVYDVASVGTKSGLVKTQVAFEEEQRNKRLSKEIGSVSKEIRKKRNQGKEIPDPRKIIQEEALSGNIQNTKDF